MCVVAFYRVLSVIVCFSLQERTTALGNENKALDESKATTEVDSAAKGGSEEGAEDNGDKNEEKSDDQEKEE